MPRLPRNQERTSIPNVKAAFAAKLQRWRPCRRCGRRREDLADGLCERCQDAPMASRPGAPVGLGFDVVAILRTLLLGDPELTARLDSAFRKAVRS